ncbi:MAG: CTB family bacteriocin [Nostoc sp.]|uniref:CTB family bacteriocin n=1 Tax=Nostoc sp. TaxID=1180 RepID=UPI002FFB30D7
MSKDIKPEVSELFLDLSAQQQEIISGGRSLSSGLYFENLFFQKTDIETFANSAINISGSNGSISSIQQTGYRFSQITFGFSLGNQIRGGRSARRNSGLFNMLFSMMSLLG